MSFIGKAFLNSDWNHNRFNSSSTRKVQNEVESNVKKEKYVIKYIGKKGEYKTKLVELNKQVVAPPKINHNLKIRDKILKPYIDVEGLSEKDKMLGTGIIKDGHLKMEIKNINSKLPLKLKIFGDDSIDWTFDDHNEIVFDMIGNKFSGKLVGAVRSDGGDISSDYIFIDLLENKRGTEHQFKDSFLPYTLMYDDNK